MNSRAAPANRDVVYWVNDLDEICFANARYDEFADDNFGHAVRSAQVLNRSLWNFISDPATRALYQRALVRVRQGRRLHFDFRCDTPTWRRAMQMQMTCVESGTVEFRVRTLAEQQRTQPMPLEYRVLHSQHMLRMCSWCKKVAVGDSWLEVEDAVTRLELFERPITPAISHGMCGACHQAILKTLKM